MIMRDDLRFYSQNPTTLTASLRVWQKATSTFANQHIGTILYEEHPGRFVAYRGMNPVAVGTNVYDVAMVLAQMRTQFEGDNVDDDAPS